MLGWGKSISPNNGGNRLLIYFPFYDVECCYFLQDWSEWLERLWKIYHFVDRNLQNWFAVWTMNQWLLLRNLMWQPSKRCGMMKESSTAMTGVESISWQILPNSMINFFNCLCEEFFLHFIRVKLLHHTQTD